MAITFVGSAANATSGDAGSLSVTISGTGRAAGDLMVLIAHNWSNCTWATPSGWTLLADFQGAGDTACFYKVSNGSETSVLVDPNTTDAGFSGTVGVYRGVDTTTPWDVAYGDSTNSSQSSVDVDQITTVTDGAWHLIYVAQAHTNNNDSTFTTPSGYTARQHAHGNNTAANKGTASQLFDREIPTAGATAPTSVSSNRTTTGLSWSLALRPAAGADEFVDIVRAGPGLSVQAAYVDIVRVGLGLSVPAVITDSPFFVSDPRADGAPTPARAFIYLPDGLIP